MGINTKIIKECILCKSNAIRLNQELSVDGLVELYKSEYNVDVSSEFSDLSTIEYVTCTNCHLDFFNPICAGSGSFYERLQESQEQVYYNPKRIEFNYAKEQINANDSVLEIGAGSGFFAEMISENDYVGLEYNDKAIIDASKKGIKLLKQSVENYSLETTITYDVVCSFHVMEHVTNAFDFINSSVNLLKPNGKMIVSVPCNDSAFSNNLNHVLNLPPHHTIRWTIKSIKQIAELFDLDIISYEIHGSNNASSSKTYLKNHLLNKVIHTFYPKNKVFIDSGKLKTVKRYTDFLVNKLRLYLFFSAKKVIGGNMTFVFQKKQGAI